MLEVRMDPEYYDPDCLSECCHAPVIGGYLYDSLGCYTCTECGDNDCLLIEKEEAEDAEG